MNLNWFEIFEAGTHTDNAGQQHTYTDADLDDIAQKYNEKGAKVDPAPLVIGHPRESDPAYGWVEILKREGSKLLAKARDVVPEFASMVEKMMFPHRSISIRKDNSLRHVGFLGAAHPAVKGLADLKFSDADESVVFEFASADDKKAQEARSKKYGIGIKKDGNVAKPEKYSNISDSDFADPVNYKYPIDEGHIQAALSYWGKPDNRSAYSAEEVKIITAKIVRAAKKFGKEIDKTKWNFDEADDGKFFAVSRIFQSLRDFVIEKFGADTADKIVTPYDIDFVKTPTVESSTAAPLFDEGENDMEKGELQKQAEFAEKQKAAEAEIVKLRQELEAERAKARRVEFEKFCENNIKKVTPGHRAEIVDLMEVLSTTTEYEFSEIDDKTKETKKVKKSPLDVFKTFVGSMKDAVNFGEFATKQNAPEQESTDSIEDRAKKAQDYVESERAKGRIVSYTEAVHQVREEKK